MSERATQYRRLAIATRQQAGQAKAPHLREAFEEVARNWLALAKQAEWLDRHHAYSPPPTDAEKVSVCSLQKQH
jgi:hypothetical protein